MGPPKKVQNNNKKLVLLIIIAATFFMYLWLGGEVEKTPSAETLERVLNSGELTVITANNAHCYYSYRGEPMGFEFDLARAFADYLGVKLKVLEKEKWDDMLPALEKGEGDFVAANITILPERRQRALFSQPYLGIQQHIITQRRYDKIKTGHDLNGKSVHVQRGIARRLLKQMEERKLRPKIVYHDNLSDEELIKLVSQGEIQMAVAGSNMALLNRRYYPKIKIGPPLSEKEFLGWAVKSDSPELLGRINGFFKSIKENGKFQEIYDRYYADIDNFNYLDIKTFNRRFKEKFPKYQAHTREAAEKHDFDWRLIAAQMYQESHFNPKARSNAGALGLMQLTHKTANEMGVRNILNPKQNISAGVKYLRSLYDFFDKARGSDKLNIALAAYNVGQGHILDARNLARDMDLDPDKWSSLAKTLPLLGKREYFKDSLYGYCRGAEPVEYIKRIRLYYDILKRQEVEYRTGVKGNEYAAHPEG